MKLFISWSGRRSKEIAKILYDWIPQILQSVTPFMSDVDVQSGERSLDIINTSLKDTSFGILIVTKDNMDNPWLNYEAGALYKGLDGNHVVPILFEGMKFSDIQGPLTQFQGKIFEKDSIFKLIKDINSYNNNPVGERVIERTFEVFWDQLETSVEDAFTKLGQSTAEATKITPEDKIDEILLLVRGLNKKNRTSSSSSNSSVNSLNKVMIELISKNLATDSMIETFNKILSSKENGELNTNKKFSESMKQLTFDLTDSDKMIEEDEE